MVGDLLLESERLRLRPFCEEDVDAVYLGWLNDPAVTRYSNQRFRRHDEASARAYLATFADSPNLFLSVRRRDDDRAVGTMTSYVSPHHGTADVGIMIGAREARGQGFGQEAWDLLLAHLLARPDIRKVTAGTLACNAAMIRLADRSGMALEGRRRDQELVEGQSYDMLYFGRFANA
ncbi:MAG: GNAT family N-acetyltransferase [Allosphingosinicella sp.]